MFKKTTLAFLWLALVITPVSALTHPSRQIEKVENKTLIVEHVYSYAVRHYKQPAILDPVSKDLINFKSPEDALAAIVSGMSAGDVQWILSCFDDDSRARLDGLLAKDSIKEKTLRSWKAHYEDSTSHLRRWIDGDGVIILEYVTVNKDDKETTNTLSFFQTSSGWRVTNTRADYPVLNFLDEERVQVPGE